MSEASSPSAYAVQGELQRVGDVVTGWCWSADVPSERLAVGVRIDGVLAGMVMAARLRLDLVRNGMCDGYHGFTIALPSPTAAYSMIEAFERETAQVFARLVSGAMADCGAWSGRVSALTNAVAELQAGLLGQVCAPALPQIAREAGRTFRRGRETGPTVPRLPRYKSPAASLILIGSRSAAETKAAIIRLAPLLGYYKAELIVVAPIGAVTAADTLTQVEPAANAAATMQSAALAARGRRLVFLQAAQVSSTGVTHLLGHDTGTVLLGVSAMQAAEVAGLFRAPNSLGETFRSGLVVDVGRAEFDQAGGFDCEMDDGAGLHLVDLALRLQQGGGAPELRIETSAEPPLLPSHLLARRRFAARWAGSIWPPDVDAVSLEAAE